MHKPEHCEIVKGSSDHMDCSAKLLVASHDLKPGLKAATEATKSDSTRPSHDRPDQLEPPLPGRDAPSKPAPPPSVLSTDKWLEFNLGRLGLHFDSQAMRHNFGDIQWGQNGLTFHGPDGNKSGGKDDGSNHTDKPQDTPPDSSGLKPSAGDTGGGAAKSHKAEVHTMPSWTMPHHTSR